MNKVQQRRYRDNLHSIAELQADGNRLLYLDDIAGYMRMERGSTITMYIKVGHFWKPSTAHTR